MTRDEQGHAYTYDAWNRLASATVGTQQELYGYVADSTRASIWDVSVKTTYSFYSADWQALEDNDSVSGPVYSYVWGLGYIDDLVARDDASSNRIYAQHDATWNVTALIGKISGVWQVVERFAYDPYGVATVLTSAYASTTDSKDWVYRWQDGRYNTVTGLYNFRYRDYSPTLGVWIEKDPAGYIDGPNVYQAMLGEPIGNVDPMGLSGTAGTGSSQPTTRPASTSPTGSGQPTTKPTPPPTLSPAQRELIALTLAAQAWNRTSPPWSYMTNNCALQARALAGYLASLRPKYWSPTDDGGYHQAPPPFGLHHVTVLMPVGGNTEEPEVLDPFKGLWSGSTTVQATSAKRFRDLYPYDCGCCKFHVLPVRPMPQVENPWRGEWDW
jgi:RHS repeat-associated protein